MKAAVVGCGAIAPLHIKGLIKEGVAITGLCDTDAERAKNLKDRFELKDCKIYTDYDKLLDSGEADSVHICTPHHLHAEMSIKALSRNINVLCEKPMCITLKEAEAIKAAEAASKAVFGVCFQNRYIYSTVQAQSLLKGRKVKSIAATLLWNRDKDYYVLSGWRGKMATEGGGVLINQAIHTLDIMLLLSGMPQSIEAFVANRHLKGIIDVEDTAEIYYSVNGTACQLFASTASGANYPISIRVEAEGLHLTITGDKLYVDGEAAECASGPLSGKDYWGKGHTLIIEDFYKSVATGSKFYIDAAEGEKSLKVLLAAYRSDSKEIKI